MADVVAAMRSRFYKGWSESQLQRKYTVYKDVMKFAVEEANNHKYEWTARRKAAAGTTTFYNAFKPVRRGDTATHPERPAPYGDDATGWCSTACN
jgi:hypothetical protein